MSRSIHSMTFPSATRHLVEVRRFVEQHARAAGFDDDAREELKLAVDEACTNIIEHAYQYDDAHEIDLAILAESDRLIVRIRDEGKAFDPSTYQEPDLAQMTRERRGGGLGVHLMRQLMDRVDYERQGHTNEVRLTKFHPQQVEQ